MKILFQQQTIQLDPYMTAEKVLDEINNLLKKNYNFSHFIADGVEVYEDHGEFLTNHSGEISELEIVAKTVREFTNDILLSVENYTEQAKQILDTLSNEFYNNPSGESWSKFAQLMESLQWIISVFGLLNIQEKTVSNWPQYEEISANIQRELINLEEALENEDFVLIGDIIQYEIAPNFEALHGAAKTTIDAEGTRSNLN